MNNKPPYQASVELHTDEKWQWHFKLNTCWQEVISYLDFLAGKHPARFVYASPEDIAAHTQDWRGQPKDWCRKCETRVRGATNVDSSGHCPECGMPIYHRPYSVIAVKKVLAGLEDFGLLIPAPGVTKKGRPETGFYLIDHYSATVPHGDRCVWWERILEDGTPVPFDHRTASAGAALVDRPGKVSWRKETRGRKGKRKGSS